MDSVGRVVAALRGLEPDKVPIALGFSGAELASIAPADEAAKYRLDVRFVAFRPSREQVAFQEYVVSLPRDTRIGGPALLRTYSDWGYKPDLAETNPLARAKSPADLENYPWPDITAPYRQESLAADVETLHQQGYAVGGNLPHLGGELFETGSRLRGFQNFSLDLIERPELASALLDRLTLMAAHNAAALSSAGVDVLVLDDDVGMPEHMIISPLLWRRYLRARMERIIAAARAVSPELCVLYHSDGVIAPILADLVAIGVDAINPVQPDRMDAEAIRREFGPRLALWGTVGTQEALARGTPEQIRAEVRLRIETLGRTGLVLAPAYDVDEPDIPWPNLRAFLEAAAEYG